MDFWNESSEGISMTAKNHGAKSRNLWSARILGRRGKWRGKNGPLSPLAGDVVHFRPHPSFRGIRRSSGGAGKENFPRSLVVDRAERLTREVGVGRFFHGGINLSAILMTTVLRIIRRGYPPLSLPCWLKPTFLENWLRFHESSLSFSLVPFVSFRPFFAPKKETARRGRGGGESPQGGETMTWLTNGNSFPLLPRSRLIIFSETSTFNWCFLIDCPSPSDARTTKAFETRISRCSNSVWQVSFALPTSLWTYLCLSSPSPSRTR